MQINLRLAKEAEISTSHRKVRIRKKRWNQSSLLSK